MKRNVLSRYERDNTGRVIIDVSAVRTDDLYNNFDKSSPYIRRDLDKDLTDYLISCVQELDGEPFVIRFTLLTPMEETHIERVSGSVKGYFAYIHGMERRSRLHRLKRSAGFLFLGLAILSSLIWNGRAHSDFRSIAGSVLAEGLSVVAWVSMWEAVAGVMMEWIPHRRRLDVYRRLVEAELMFRFINSSPLPEQPATPSTYQTPK